MQERGIDRCRTRGIDEQKVYVIIKANPPTFLSNVQYIEGFYGNQLESEDYYWAQFIFAFSYIKANMLSTI